MRASIAAVPLPLPLLLLLGLCAAPAASAQGGGNEVPRELLQALTFSGSIVVGRVPEGVPAEAVPAGARAVGGESRGRSSTTILALPQPPREAIATYRAQLERAGWRASTDPRMQYPADASILGMCGPGQTMLAAAATPRGEGGSELYLIVGRPDPRDSPCGGVRPPSAADVPFPQLAPPAGLHFMGSSSGGGPEDRQLDGRLETAMPPAEIAADFLAQLRRAGWSAAQPRVDEGAATGWAELRDARGTQWRALVAVMPVSAGERDVLVRVVAASPPPSPTGMEWGSLPRPAGGTVPAELAHALLERPTGRGEAERPTLLSGRLPQELAGAPLPAGGRVVGGVSYAEQATGLVFVPGAAPDLLAAYAQALQRAGWMANPARREVFTGRPGLVYPREFCTPGGRHAIVGEIPLQDGGRYLKLETFGTEGLCTREAVDAFARIPLPVLPSPEGATLSHDGGGGGTPDDWDARVRLESSLTPAALVDHYAALLRQAGWTVRPTSGEANGATASAELRDAQGQAWHGLIAAVALSPTYSEVMVRIVHAQTDSPNYTVSHDLLCKINVILREPLRRTRVVEEAWRRPKDLYRRQRNG